jgi:hypothetical protein
MTPAGLIGAAAIVCAIEFAVETRRIEFTHVYTMDWRDTRGALNERTSGASILLLGDSRIKFGIAPRVVAAKTGESTYNAAVCAGQPPACYFALRRGLDHGASPRAIVVGMAPHLMMSGVHFNARQWPELLTTGELIELALATRNATLCADWTVRPAIPSYHRRVEIRDAIVRGLLRRESDQTWKKQAYARNWERNLGAQINPGGDFSIDRAEPREWRAFVKKNWRCDATNYKYLIKLLDLAHDRKIAVYWLLHPAPSVLRIQSEAIGMDAEFEKFTRSLLLRYPNLKVIDGLKARYPDRVFMDPLHLAAPGAVSLSEDLGAILARDRDRPSSDRRIVLPDYHDTPIDRELVAIVETPPASRSSKKIEPKSASIVDRVRDRSATRARFDADSPTIKDIGPKHHDD